MATPWTHGVEWFVDATQCIAARLRDADKLQQLFDRIVSDLDLHPIGKSRWHRFPNPGGLTGFWMLKESHLACHTFPEYRSICLNLFCCRPRPVWSWEKQLGEFLGAQQISIRSFERHYGSQLQEETA